MGNTFGDRLKSLRQKAGLSGSALALRVGVTEGAIRQLESGRSKNASLQTAVKLAGALGVSPAYLAFGEERFDSSPPGADRLEAVEARLAGLEDRQAAGLRDGEKALAELQQRLLALESRAGRAKRA